MTVLILSSLFSGLRADSSPRSHHVQNLPIKLSNYYLTKFDSNLFHYKSFIFLFSKKHRKKKVRQKSSSGSDDESEGKVLPTDKKDAQFEYQIDQFF